MDAPKTSERWKLSHWREPSLRSISFPINEHHYKIERQMLNLLKQNQSVATRNKFTNFIFNYQLSFKADVIDWLTDYSNVCYNIEIETIWEII